MREHKLYLRPEKCEFEKTKIEYLGVIISHNKVEMDPVKIAGVADWLTPSNTKEVQSFVGFVNFYRCFILGFPHHAHALFDLTMKDVRFIWGLPQEDSFMKLKEPITVRGMCGPILNIIPACRTRRFCGQLSTTSCDCDRYGHSQY
jgi:hypothetical protein